ncbi:MAG: ribosomal L7Ae/L30e/S12e/Gadd45 family protein [Candidatus Izemoplasmatales bacterium]|jgi:ribosomal protein L7Ae-like RNA K-turn-binding protein|nr:ribosomal L7Ae/L30e/S12e/Gadd45 family protein [Candidatus Izemoplasmatales bacterium]
MNKERILSTLGLAYVASGLVSGEEFTLKEIKRGRAYLVFLASDAGPNTTKRVSDKSLFYHSRIIHDFTSLELSKAIGKDNRKALAITNQKFAKLLRDALNE